MGNDKLKKVSVLSREEYIRQLAASMEPLDICLTNDYAFRRIFKNKIVAKGFLMALLEVYSSKFLFHVIELKKLEEASEEEKGRTYMETAKDEMEKINKSEEERYLYLRREMAVSDEKSRMDTARKEGIKEGEDRVSRLNLLLIAETRYEDLEMASKDKEYRDKLFRDYGI